MRMRRGQFDLSYIVYLSFALVIFLLFKLLTPPPPPPVNIKGTWEGEWNLSAGIGPFSIMGPKSNFVLKLEEDSSGNLWGSVYFPGNTMLATSVIAGTVSGNNVNFTFSTPIKTESSTSGSAPVTITGDFSFSGTVSPSLTIMNGTLGIDMKSAVGMGILTLSGPSLSVGGNWTASKE